MIRKLNKLQPGDFIKVLKNRTVEDNNIYKVVQVEPKIYFDDLGLEQIAYGEIEVEPFYEEKPLTGHKHLKLSNGNIILMNPRLLKIEPKIKEA